MDDELKYIRGKVDKIDERLDSVDKTLAVNTELLDVHIKRTNLLEDQLQNIRTHVEGVKLFGKVLSWGVGIVAAVVGLLSGLKII